MSRSRGGLASAIRCGLQVNTVVHYEIYEVSDPGKPLIVMNFNILLDGT